MAFQPHKQCKTCQRVKVDKILYKRIFASKFYKKGGEALKEIARDEGLHYLGLLNHVKKHQHLTDDKLLTSQLNEIAKAESRKAVRQVIKTSDTRAAVTQKLAQKMENADLDELSTKDLLQLLLKAIKDTDDVQAKAKDQDIDILKMMGGVRAGEVQDTAKHYDEFNPWDEPEEAEVVG